MLASPFGQDCLFIEDFQGETIVGVYPHEQAAPQPISLDLLLGFDTRASAQSCHLSDTIDYDQVIECIEWRLMDSRFQLLETLGHHLCQDCFKRFPITWAHLRLHKPGLFPNIRKAGIQLFRTRADYEKD